MSWTAVVVGGSALLGAFSSNKAAKAQQAAAQQAAASQERMFDKQVQLQEPFRQAGVTGLNRLNYLLGLSTDPGTGGGTKALSYDVLRQQLTPQFTTKQAGTRKEQDPFWSPEDPTQNRLIDVAADTNVVNQGALDAEILRRMQEDEATRMAQANGDTQFGSLMRDFSMNDFEQDPGYAFRLSEGQKALDRSAAARGGLQSGSALKAAARYGQDMGSQEYQNAFNRYQINRANKLQPLQSLAGMAQSSANTLTGAAGQLGQGLAESQIGAGNARASGYMGTANAISGGLGSYLNYQQGQNYLNALKGTT